eukprot:scaffold6646_cov43-Prasinocladus_malaysianus.AAC.1
MIMLEWQYLAGCVYAWVRGGHLDWSGDLPLVERSMRPAAGNDKWPSRHGWCPPPTAHPRGLCALRPQ